MGKSHLAQVASGQEVDTPHACACADGGGGIKQEGLEVRREPEQMVWAWNKRLSAKQFSQKDKRWGQDEERVSDLDPLND